MVWSTGVWHRFRPDYLCDGVWVYQQTGSAAKFTTIALLSACANIFIIAGRISDKWFEPMLASGGVLSDSVGRLLGVGPGRGMGLIFVIAGTIAIIIQIVAFNLPTLRRAESLLPDAISD
ncbi:MAG: hypothetical protein AABN95_01275 [Acidobacteriota bacterium]